MKKNIENQDERSHKNAKKKLLIILISIFSLLVVLIGLSFVIDLLESNDSQGSEIDYNFYPVDFSENIFEDDEYLEHIEGEFMSFCDSSTNLTLGINRETATQQGIEVEFIVEMLYKIICGDNEGYNKCFSKEYYKKNSPKDQFTMQKVYDVLITKVSSDKISDENNSDYTKSIYILEYKIYHNNGSFRRDIGDGSKKQYITITDRSGQLLIDSITTVNIK